jgi:AAA domain (dynein-related subfamily)
LDMFYPFYRMEHISKEQKKFMAIVYEQFEIERELFCSYHLQQQENQVVLSSESSGNVFSFPLGNILEPSTHYVPTIAHESCLRNMLMLHSLGSDFMLIGPKFGKTKLVKMFARILKRKLVTVSLYKDISPRDILQRRATSFSGDTIW